MILLLAFSQEILMLSLYNTSNGKGNPVHPRKDPCQNGNAPPHHPCRGQLFLFSLLFSFFWMPRKDNTNDTHSSYSPQDRPLQAPTRSRVNDHSEHQIGDVNIDDTLGGGYAAFENCEEIEDQGKGKLPLPKGRKDWRPSITEQRKSSLVSRVETAGKDGKMQYFRLYYLDSLVLIIEPCLQRFADHPHIYRLKNLL